MESSSLVLGNQPWRLCFLPFANRNPDSKVHGANMGPIWGLQDPGGPHVGPMNFAIWEHITARRLYGSWDVLYLSTVALSWLNAVWLRQDKIKL